MNRELLDYLYRYSITPETVGEHREALAQFFSSSQECDRFILNYFSTIFQADYQEYMKNGQLFDVFPITRQYGQTYTNNYYCVQYNRKGRCPGFLNGQAFILDESDVLMLSPGISQQAYQMETDDCIICAVLPRTNILQLLPRLLRTASPISEFFFAGGADNARGLSLHIKTGEDPVLRDMFLRLFTYFQKKESSDEALEGYYATLLEGILLYLAAFHRKHIEQRIQQEQAGDGMQKIFSYISENLDTISLSRVAGRFGYSEPYVSRLIKNRTGYSFTEILRAFRLEKASRLLVMTDDSVEDIMIQTGYLGRTNFFAQFRKRFGCSPQDYRQKNRPEQIERAVCSIPGN